MIRRPPRSTQSRSSAASDVYKRQQQDQERGEHQQAAPQQVGDVDPGGAQLRVPGDGEEGTNREERDDRGDEEALQEERRLCVAHPSGKGSICLLYTSPSPRD